MAGIRPIGNEWNPPAAMFGGVPPAPPPPPPPPSETPSGWRADAFQYSGGVIVLTGASSEIISFGGETSPPNGVETMGNGPKTTGKRYFEIVGTDITNQTNVGFSVGTYATPAINFEVSDEQAVAMFDNAGGFFYVFDIDNPPGQSAFWNDTSLWNTVGLFTDGGVYGFAIDLDIGRLDAIYLNGVEIWPALTDPADYAAQLPLSTWAPNLPVQAYINWRVSDQLNGEVRLSTITAQFAYPIPAGYIAWGTD